MRKNVSSVAGSSSKSSPFKGGSDSKAIVDARSALTWKVVDGEKARTAARGYRTQI